MVVKSLFNIAVKGVEDIREASLGAKFDVGLSVSCLALAMVDMVRGDDPTFSLLAAYVMADSAYDSIAGDKERLRLEKNQKISEIIGALRDSVAMNDHDAPTPNT
mgnify:CR=1 FL=1